MLRRRTFLAAALLLAAAPAVAQDAKAQEKLPVVATFSILGDFVKNVSGDRVALTTLVGPNGDAHVYAPSPADARKLAEAKLVIVNGLRYEGWIGRLVKASGTKAALAVASKGVKAREAEGHDDHSLDPHAWQSVANAKIYVVNIRDALTLADPAGRDIYARNAADYLKKLDVLDAEIKASIAAISPARRKIITTHDAFGYFRLAYGIEFITPQGVSTDAEASAQDVARIIRQIKAQKIPAVFLENVSDPRLIKRIAEETGARIGGTLFSDALSGDKGPAPTYIDMMRHNLKQLSAALTS